MLSTALYPNYDKKMTVSVRFTRLKTWAAIIMIVIASFVTTGCSTKHELKPTASVIIGGHKSI